MRSSQSAIGRVSSTLKIDAKILRNVICWPVMSFRVARQLRRFRGESGNRASVRQASCRSATSGTRAISAACREENPMVGRHVPPDDLAESTRGRLRSNGPRKVLSEIGCLD
jgi:hypothetical protein